MAVLTRRRMQVAPNQTIKDPGTTGGGGGGAGDEPTPGVGGGGGQVPVATGTPGVIGGGRFAGGGVHGGAPPPEPVTPFGTPFAGVDPNARSVAQPGLGVAPQALPATTYRIPEFDVGNIQQHPVMQQALAAFEAAQLPMLQRQMSAAGAGHSGAAGQLFQRGLAEAQLGALGQILPAALQERQQDIGAVMGIRGQDIGLQQARQQALLEQGRQALQARGQDFSSVQAGMQGALGTQQAQLAQYLAGLEQAQGLGGRARSIEDARLQAEYDELMRRYGLARDVRFGPMGQLTSQVGSSVRSGK